MSPDEIDAAAGLLKALGKLASEIRLGENVAPADRDRRAILQVWLDTTAEHLLLDKQWLDKLPDAPMATFDRGKENLELRLARLAEEGI